MQTENTTMLQRFFPDKNNRIAICCPSCNATKITNVARFKHNKKEITARCKCGTIFKFRVEFRKHYRKKVKLPGGYVILPKRGMGQMLIEDISVSGVCFVNLDPHRINTSDVLKVNFILDNTKRSEIHRKLAVVSVRDKLVGGKFIDRSYENDIGFYLR
jgi:hypothetical protein